MTLLTLDNIADSLKNDIKVKVAGVDSSGILRGKVMSKDKFLSTVESGFGFSSAVFGWDMHDALYADPESSAMASENGGYSDFIAVADLPSFRRLPWEENIPFFLLRFTVNDKPVVACPRSMLAGITQKLAQNNVKALAGVELEFFNFQTPTEDGYGVGGSRPDVAGFLAKNAPGALRPITQGMFGYSMTRPTASKKYFYDIFNTCVSVGCDLEIQHTESGPGVYEAALAVKEVSEMADRVSLFKLTTKSIAMDHNITPCFMAKPLYGWPGSSGHIHMSLTDASGKNLFARETRDDSARWRDIASFSDMGRHFLAGILDALPDIMPLLAPNINSYKRFVENCWVPVRLNWGLEDRLVSVRLIAPPVCKAAATRMEIRIPGADLHPHYALSALLKAGMRGVEKKLDIPVPPASARSNEEAALLPNTLDEATRRFKAPGSVAREIFGDTFVEFYAASSEHELRLWREAITDWELKRYIEIA
ncbi:hypothetical protein VF21_06494 [Pseudogymnoascus sp. 05NY08]|nr:hypothetical protein VF21_06494 [Pseudogymnoascus sp. 05NY08]